eukprot:64907-Pyramimonas_sp.AAC.1
MHGGSSGPLLGVSPRPSGSLLELCTVPGGGLLLWAVAASVGARGGAPTLPAAPPMRAALAAAG